MSESRIKGAVLCRCRDEYGEIVVAEEDNERTLYFGEGVVQSTIRMDNPGLLLEDYNQALMVALLFKPEPKSILLIGLGGCSLVHFLMKALPFSALDVVEIRRQVIDISRKYFLLPPGKGNLRIFHAAGEEFIGCGRTNDKSYDMIIVDAFDETGPAAALMEKDFLSSCRFRLNSNGVFAVNLWNSPGSDFPARYASMQSAFENNALKLLLSESYRNAVAFGFNNPATCRNLPEYRGMAEKLKSNHGINFPKYLRYLHWQNFNNEDQ